MPDWKRHVRERLDLTGVAAERETEIVEELASYVEDAYREAITRGESENDAVFFAWQQVGDLGKLSENYARSGRSALLHSAFLRMWRPRTGYESTAWAREVAG